MSASLGFRGEEGEFVLVGPLAYQGKEGCESVTCTRTGFTRRDDGTVDMGRCMGWHCSYCDAPCSSQGHNCDAAKAVLGEAERATREEHSQ